MLLLKSNNSRIIDFELGLYGFIYTAAQILFNNSILTSFVYGHIIKSLIHQGWETIMNHIVQIIMLINHKISIMSSIDSCTIHCKFMSSIKTIEISNSRVVQIFNNICIQCRISAKFDNIIVINATSNEGEITNMP